MSNFLGFIDETGVLEEDPQQRFFGLGLLKIKNTSTFYEELVKLKQKVLCKLSRLKKPFEFKFSKINNSNYKFYYELIEIYFSFPDNHFCALVIDKRHPNFNMNKYFPNAWEAYIGYSRLLIKKNVHSDEKICILADYHSKPKASSKYYEVELIKIRRNYKNIVFNACMLESHASLFIQVVDVLLGSIVYEFKIRNKLLSNKPNRRKKGLLNLIKKKLKTNNLAQNFTRNKPNYFSVWCFNPKDR